ncbi:MAG: YbaY family lipoprotein [Chloroflexaceae bacterium]|nr:YbaY family lipoprotein [Chloroflexaceae bacterium]
MLPIHHLFRVLFYPVLLGMLLAACAAPPTPSPTATPPSAATVTVAPTTTPLAARAYRLGQADVSVEVGGGVVEPLELRGTIAAPAGAGPHPVVLVLHGSHAVCPMQPQSPEEPMICPQATQFRNDPGLGYLLEALAAQGALALAPDLNTAFRAEFGGLEQETERLRFVVERHLEQLAAGAPAFGLDPGLTVDPARLYLIGHSLGGNGAYEIATAWAEDVPAPGGWGPARALLLLAPPVAGGFDSVPPLDVPLAVVLPECDGDVSSLEGQHHVEAARLDPGRRSPAVAYLLQGGNHNFFNAAVELDDGQRFLSRCLPEAPRLSREGQEQFLAGLAPALLSAWESGDANAIPGLDPTRPVPTTLYGAPVLLVPVAPAEQRRPILPGTASSELTAGPLGGAVQVEGAELDFCPYGMAGSGSPCRAGVSNPGMPAQLHLAWDAPGAALRVAIPPAFADASAASALQLRLAVDPLDRRSPAGEMQRMRVILRDSAGGEAAQLVTVAFPPGKVLGENWFGHVFPGMVRLPLAALTGVDLARLAEVALRPENPSGALFLADMELVTDGAAISGPQRPSPFRSLSGAVAVPELSDAPEGSRLIVRLEFAVNDGEGPRFVTIQPDMVAGAPPFPFALRYHQAAIDDRRDYVIDAILQLPDGQSFSSPAPVPAITDGAPQQDIALELARVIVVEPTPVPTDRTFRLTVRAPAGRPFPPGAQVSVTLSRLDASGIGVDTLAVAGATIGDQSAESVQIEAPYWSGAVEPGAPYGVSVMVFAADGFTRLAETDGNIPVDLAAGEAVVELTPVAP